MPRTRGGQFLSCHRFHRVALAISYRVAESSRYRRESVRETGAIQCGQLQYFPVVVLLRLRVYGSRTYISASFFSIDPLG